MNLFKIDEKNESRLIKQSDKEYSEQEIEDLLENNSELITGEKILFIGRQVITATGKRLDLLAVDKYGKLVVIELKKGYAPRDIIAQVLDYTSWLNKLSERELEKIAKDYFEKRSIKYKTVHEAFEKVFGRELNIALGDEIISILFAKEFSKEVITPAEYLNEKGVPIKCVKFEIFETGNEKYFLTQNTVGEEDIEDTEKGFFVSPSKSLFKQIINKLTKFLEDNYGSWSTSLGSERLYQFKTYQDRQGTWTTSYVDWLYKDETKFCLEFGIYPESDGKSKGFSAYRGDA